VTPAFKVYLVATLRLCAATIEHGNESIEAEAIRKQMDDAAWHTLTTRQQEELRELSAHIDRLEALE
jgi:hypothetical protein